MFEFVGVVDDEFVVVGLCCLFVDCVFVGGGDVECNVLFFWFL